jgi:hypothetical protein
MIEHFRDLADQLASLPGGTAKLREDYFAGVTVDGLPDGAERALQAALGEGYILAEGWALAGGGVLALAVAHGGEARLAWLDEKAETVLDYPAGLVDAAREHGVPPLGLAMLVQAMGTVDDGRRLRRLLPQVDKAAKGLLLIASCRLCG